MKISTRGLMAIMSHEGIVKTRYKDSKGIWTIGVGHTAAAGGINPVTYAGEMTIKEVIDLLRTDIVKYENGVNAAVKVPLEQHEFDALVSFHYNTGAIAKATLTKTLNAGNKSLAGEQLMNWVKPPEIKERRSQERSLFLNGVYPPPYATIYPADSAGRVLWAKGTRVSLSELLGETPPPPDAPEPKPQEPSEPGEIPTIAQAIAALIAAIFGKRG